MPKLPAVATFWLGRVFLLLLLAGAWTPPAPAAVGRWALVIGNDEYKRVEPLRNAVADSALIAVELKRAGFEVASFTNVDRRTLLREVVALSRRAEGGGDAVIYFAGHGVQVANTNYLLPVDFDSGDEALLPFEAVSLTEIGNQLLDAKARFSLLIVDACRNNPLPGRRGRNLRTGPGLAPMSPATGQMVVFAAGSGQVALDGLGDRDSTRNGVFAREFAREMRTPGVDVRDLVLTVRESVERLAASVNHVQRPAIYDESRGRFVFHAAPPSASEPAQTGSQSRAQAGTGGKSADVIEDDLWTAFSGSKSRAGFAAYLREYPNGRYAGAARVQLEILGRADEGQPAARPAPAGPAPVPTPAAPPPTGPPQKNGREQPPAAPSAAVAARDATAETAAAASSLGPRARLNGKRFRGMDGQFELRVKAAEQALVVESFRMHSGRFSGTELRCGVLRNRIDIDEQLKVSAWCSGAIPGSLRLAGQFPRIDIYTSGAFGGGTVDLAEIVDGN